MRKFSTFQGLFTKTPVYSSPQDTAPQPPRENITAQSVTETPQPHTPPLSLKAVQCYKSLHDHDVAVRNLLQQSKPH